MAWTLQTLALQNNVPTNGMTVNVYVVTRFALPATDAAVPDGNPADAGPATSAADPVAGAGYFTLVVPDGEPYWLQASGGGDGHTYWYGPIVGVLDSTQQAFAGSVNQAANRVFASTFLNGSQTFPEATITVSGIGRFTKSGIIAVGYLGDGITSSQTFVSYTNATGVTFTGGTGGTGTFPSGSPVIQAYQNGNNRRLVSVSFSPTVSASGDKAYLTAYGTVRGQFQRIAQVGIFNTSAAVGITPEYILMFPVDPLGYYGVGATLAGAGTMPATPDRWMEFDF